MLTKGTDGKYAPPATVPTMTDKLMTALKAPILTADQGLDSSESLYAAVVWGAIGLGAGSYLGRKNQAAGKAPVLGVFL